MICEVGKLKQVQPSPHGLVWGGVGRCTGGRGEVRNRFRHDNQYGIFSNTKRAAVEGDSYGWIGVKATG